jgi:hypothetical protein
VCAVAAASLDAAYFSTSASSGAAHAGLLNGLNPLTGVAIMQDDLAHWPRVSATMALATLFSSLVLVGLLGQDTHTAWHGDFPCVWRSRLIESSRSIRFTWCTALVTTRISRPPTTRPCILTQRRSQLGIVGTPNVVAAPTQSLFQTASLALRLLLDLGFAAPSERGGDPDGVHVVTELPAVPGGADRQSGGRLGGVRPGQFGECPPQVR